MYDGDVLRICEEPFVNAVAERLDELDFGRIMVVEGEHSNSVVELGDVVAALGAQIVDVVVVLVLRLEQLVDVVDVVAIHALNVRSWITHCDDVVCYV